MRRSDPRDADAAHAAGDSRSCDFADGAGSSDRRDGAGLPRPRRHGFGGRRPCPGNVALDISAVGADWYVGNLHKWYFAPRGCGFLWAHPDRRERLAPTVLSWDIDKPFPHSFEWTGTRDPSAWLSVPAAFDFMDRFGEDEVRKHNHDLVMEGTRLLARAWKVEIPTPESMITGMALAPLPAISGFSATEVDRAKIQATLWEDHRIACPCILFGGRLHVRVCAQIYNEIEDYEKLARAVSGWI